MKNNNIYSIIFKLSRLIILCLVSFSCDFDPPLKYGQFDVVFSPGYLTSNHCTRISDEIDKADRSIDIAIYSLNNEDIINSLRNAARKGIVIRMLYDEASEHRKNPEGTLSSEFERVGIDIRYVNKTLHHKFIIIDGVQSNVDEISDSLLITGSANWSTNAIIKYDENTLISDNQELILGFQQQFNLLWENSRNFPEDVEQDKYLTIPITDDMITDDPAIDTLFTSSNYTVYQSSTYGPTFRLTYRNTVANRIADEIRNAEESIDIAAGHFRTRVIAEALIEKMNTSPDMQIRVYVDGNDYITEYYYNILLQEQEECLCEAGDSELKRNDCLDKGMVFTYPLAQEGVDVRFKHYAYRWDYTYASQMHNKFMIIDNKLITGSYNLSFTSEHDCMENIVIINGADFPGIVSQYKNKFNELWNTGQDESLYSELMDYINSSSAFIPIVYQPMSLKYDEITNLKQAIGENAPEVYSYDFDEFPEDHYWANRYAGRNYIDEEHLKYINITTPEDTRSVDLDYDENGNISKIDYGSPGNPLLTYNIFYDNTNHFINIKETDGLSWTYQFTDDENIQSIYANADLFYSFAENDDVRFFTEYNDNDPSWVSTCYLDLENKSKTLKFQYNTQERIVIHDYDDNGRLVSISYPEGEFTYNTINKNEYLTDTSGGESIQVIDKYPDYRKYTYKGSYDKSITTYFDLDRRSLNVKLDNFSIKYVYDKYDNLIQADNLLLERENISGRVISSAIDNISENWEYNLFGEPVSHIVFYRGASIYSIEWQYDALGRIIVYKESINSETPVTKEFAYNKSGRLTGVKKNGEISEWYVYDIQGNIIESYRAPGVFSEYNSNNMLVKKGEIAFLYDDLGQLSARIEDNIPVLNTDYDTLGNLQSAVLYDTDKTEYAFDSFGRRVGEKNNGRWLRKFIYYGADIYPIVELDRNDNAKSFFIYSVYPNTPHVIIKRNRSYVVIADHRGSPVIVLNSRTGQIVQRIEYDAYGLELQNTAPDFQPFSFAGGLMDTGTGFVKFGERDYDPVNMRWTAKDPIGLLGSCINLYAYAGGDPVNYIDPAGWTYDFPLHHSWPVFMGGPVKQKLTSMPRQQHTKLHKDLYNYLGKNNPSMVPKRGYPSGEIRSRFGNPELKKTMRNFYKGPGSVYEDAANDFFSQFGEGESQ